MFNGQDAKANFFDQPAVDETVFLALEANGEAPNTLEGEGKLSVDVLQSESEVAIVATMAGTKPEDIELHLHNDLLTIRGHRHNPASPSFEPYFTECFWGSFSRTIVLPADVRPELARAEYRHGVLPISLPKAKPDNSIPIMVVEE